MHTIAKATALDAINLAISEKGLRTGFKAYVNGRETSVTDLTYLKHQIGCDRQALVCEYTDDRGWHCKTLH